MEKTSGQSEVVADQMYFTSNAQIVDAWAKVAELYGKGVIFYLTHTSQFAVLICEEPGNWRGEVLIDKDCVVRAVKLDCQPSLLEKGQILQPLSSGIFAEDILAVINHFFTLL